MFFLVFFCLLLFMRVLLPCSSLSQALLLLSYSIYFFSTNSSRLLNLILFYSFAFYFFSYSIFLLSIYPSIYLSSCLSISIFTLNLSQHLARNRQPIIDPNARLVFLTDAEILESKTFRLKKEASVGTVWSR